MALRELDQRQNDALKVAILWDDEHDVVILQVTELDDGNIAAVKVPKAQAIDAFRHPFRYFEASKVVA